MHQAEYKKIKSFTDLNAWKEGHQLVMQIYKVSQDFPSDQKFGLTNQIQRAAVSITSNIAEGFSRNTSKEKINFYYIALGSLTEVQNQLLIVRDLTYCTKENFMEIAEQTIVVNKLINGLIKSLKSKQTHNT